MGLFSRSKSRRDSQPAPTPETRDEGIVREFEDDLFEQEVMEFGARFLEHAKRGRTGPLSAAFWSDKLMDWAMQDEQFKVQLFRFVDAFPTLTTPEQVHDHLMDYLSQPGVSTPPGLGLGLKAGGMAKGLVSKTMAGRIRAMAEKFIAGTDAASALPKLQSLWNNGLAFSVDLLGEACVSEEEAGEYRNKYLDLVENLSGQASLWAPNPLLETDYLGPIPRTNVSIKISSLYSRTDPIDTEGSIRGLMESIGPVLESAARHGVFINFDMEQHSLKDLTMELFFRCCSEWDFQAGLAMQAYLRSGDDDARKIIDWSKRTGRQVTVRLVKGAYWDYETIQAEQEGWPIPVWSHKADTDACFERMTRQFIREMPRSTGEGGVKLALGSHNARSIATAVGLLKKHDLPTNSIELQMLHGMADQLKEAATGTGLRVREYVPVGEMIPGMAYLVRRLLENTSNESWLKAGFLDNVPTSTLLATPHRNFGRDPGLERIDGAPERHELGVSVPGLSDERPFFTEPIRDFSQKSRREDFAAAIAGSRVPAVANDSTVEQASEAVARAHAAFPGWRDTDPLHRSGIVARAAALMRDRRDELSGILIRESGKTWREADADVCEAIDFCEYYARESIGLFRPDRLGGFIGELNEQWYQPRGVAAVISPWNFPLAICMGMSVAALVTGNTVVVKPAEQTPGIARVMYDILIEAGIPAETLQFLPGRGETVGAALVRDPRVSLIAFTGSKAVGLDIIEAAAATGDAQESVKKVVCEMGGKNAVIIDASADLDEAVIGVRQSAFSFAGQKCSACSRAIVVDSAHDLFLHRLVESTRSLVVGNPLEPGTDVGPVIDQGAAEKIREYIRLGSDEGTLQVGLEVPAGLEEQVGMPYVAPHVFSDIAPDARIAQEEIFGPVLSVIRVKDFDEALQVANSTRYKLTGGVFSRKPSHLEQARREYRVGNLYLNRGITGALVGRQPFGGFGMSGVGSKAGGKDYLLQFVEPRTVTENTMRRGFAPGL
ncbi:MAG: 1-pyrroline-5-carboxylate dehydrogenase [Phycisphaerae bacterium]|nr:1-pyrroline-5-carboxylate dehydrogenase [Phycisphaerae bacterium]